MWYLHVIMPPTQLHFAVPVLNVVLLKVSTWFRLVTLYISIFDLVMGQKRRSDHLGFGANNPQGIVLL